MVSADIPRNIAITIIKTRAQKNLAGYQTGLGRPILKNLHGSVGPSPQFAVGLRMIGAWLRPVIAGRGGWVIG